MGWLEETVERAGNAFTGGNNNGGSIPNMGLNWANDLMRGKNPLNGGSLNGNDQTYQARGSNAAARMADMEAGRKRGEEIFNDDPAMKDMTARREDLAKGYDGKELGALQTQANTEMQGQRSNYLRALSGKAAQGGVGGARAAAMQGAADVGHQQNQAELQRKMTLDSANMKRTGTNELQDFMLRKKYGVLGTELGYADMGVADRSAEAQAEIANRPEKKGLLSGIFDGIL